MHLQYVEGMAKEKARQVDHNRVGAAIWIMNKNNQKKKIINQCNRKEDWRKQNKRNK